MYSSSRKLCNDSIIISCQTSQSFIQKGHFFLVKPRVKPYCLSVCVYLPSQLKIKMEHKGNGKATTIG